MAATYVDHEQMHERPGLSWFLMAMIIAFPILVVAVSWAMSYKGSGT